MKRMQTCLLGGAVLSLLIPALLAGGTATKLKVIHAPGAPVFRTPVLGRPFATLPLNTVVEAESKQGEFWKVNFDFNGQKTNGYVHEVLVEEVKEAETPGGNGASQGG